MEIQDFISFLKEKDENNFNQFVKYEKVVEANTAHFFIPQANMKEQSLIHEKIFKDCVKQAATNCHADDRVWKEFEWLFRDYCKVGGNLKQYADGMRHAASVSWNVIRFIQIQPDTGSFASVAENVIFPGLKEMMQVDFLQPCLIYELKFTELGMEEYEKNCLENDIIRAVIHFMVSGIKTDRGKLGILVYYWKVKSVVFYSTDSHQNEELVEMLREKLSSDNGETPDETEEASRLND